jgi:hypothetical protein
LAHLVMAVMAGSLQARRHWNPLDLRVEQLIEIRRPFRVRRLNASRAYGQPDVLLRHRPGGEE